MKLKYAVVSSNSNKNYIDFWPYISQAWKRIDIEPILLYIDNSDYDEWYARYNVVDRLEEFGKVYYFKPIKDFSIIQQAQSIRFWGAKLLDDNFIISDIDTVPISRDYFHDSVKNIDGGLVSYSSDINKYRWYILNPQYNMQYLAGHPKDFIDILDMNEENYTDFLIRLSKLYKKLEIVSPCGIDQKFFYNQVQKYKDKKIIHLNRGFIGGKYWDKRLDKKNWPRFRYLPHNTYKLEDYVDCSLPRPWDDGAQGDIEHKKFNQEEQNKCDELFEKLGFNKD